MGSDRRQKRLRVALLVVVILATAAAAAGAGLTRRSGADIRRHAEGGVGVRAGVCPAPSQVFDLSSLRRLSARAPGTARPEISSYGGAWPNNDPRNFVAQVSGEQALAAHLNPGGLSGTDRVVVLVSYNTTITMMSKPPSFPESKVTQVYAARIDMQDLTTGAPPMTQGVQLPACLK